MSTARKTKPQIDKPSLRERVKASREAITRAPATQQSRCAAAKLGDLLEEAWTDHDKWDEANVSTVPRGTYSDLMDAAVRRIDDLEAAISFVRATTPAGMLIQLAVASSVLDVALTGTSYAIRKSAADQVERCILSIAAALCAMSSLERETGLVRRYMPRHIDKLAILDGEAA